MHDKKEKIRKQKSLKETNKQRKTQQVLDMKKPRIEFKNIKGNFNSRLNGKSPERKI